MARKTTSPSAVIHLLTGWKKPSIALMSCSGRFDRRLTRDEAEALASRGLIEGVLTKGMLNYVQWMAGTAMPDPEIRRESAVLSIEEITGDPPSSGRAQFAAPEAFARTNLGAYRQSLREAIVELDSRDQRVVVGEGGALGWCWSLCSARRLDNATA